MTNEKVTEKEPKCVKCGKNEFELMRTIDSQITAVCIHCGEPHLLDAIDKSTGKPTSLQFWSPKMNEK
jgi:uncharacterized Zn finger protein